MLPDGITRDPHILVGWVNMKLRDAYDYDLAALLADLGITRQDLDNILIPAGYAWDEAARRYL